MPPSGRVSGAGTRSFQVERRFHWKQKDLFVEKRPVHKIRMCEGWVVPKVLEGCSDLSVKGDLIFPPIVKGIYGYWQPLRWFQPTLRLQNARSWKNVTSWPCWINPVHSGIHNLDMIFALGG